MRYIGADANNANNQVYTYTASGGETSISGADNGGSVLAFSSGANLTVHLNGALLTAGTDYDTNTANTIDGLTALTASDSVVVTVYRLHNGADAMPLVGGTFSGPVDFSNSVAGTTEVNATVTGNVTLDFSKHQNFVLTLTGNTTLDNPTTEAVGQTGFITFIQDSTGGYTVSLDTDYETAAAAGLTLSSTADTTDIVPYIVTASNRILLGAPQLAFA
jgi:hypothetical protein